jgi:hypothetical protein
MVKTMVSCRFSLKPIQWLWDFSHFSASKRAAGDHPSSPRCRGHRQLDIVQAPFGCPADCGPLGRCTLENHDIVLIIRWSADPYVLGIKLQKRFFVKMTSHWFCIMKIHVMSCHVTSPGCSTLAPGSKGANSDGRIPSSSQGTGTRFLAAAGFTLW